MEDLGMKMPTATVDLEVIRKEYHQAAGEESHKKHGNRADHNGGGDKGARKNNKNKRLGAVAST